MDFDDSSRSMLQLAGYAAICGSAAFKAPMALGDSDSSPAVRSAIDSLLSESGPILPFFTSLHL
jgi:hypothetical protein